MAAIHLLVCAGRCPVSGQDLAKADLLEVKGNPIVRPRPPAAASVPGLIKIFQSEWDALMLETYTLKQVTQAHTLNEHLVALSLVVFKKQH